MASGKNAGQAGMPPLAPADNDATQRLPLQGSHTPSPRPRPSAPRTGGSAAERRRKQREKERRTLIIILCAAALLLIGLLIVVFTLFSSPKDNDQILSNVYAAGVNIGGMTKEQAKAALHNATDHTYSKLDMTVSVLNTTITLSPDQTGASLDVDAVVQAAYDRGRTGSRSEQQQAQAQALVSAYHVPIAPYLNLNEEYIRGQINELGQKYSTTLSQTTYEISGNAPSMDMKEKDTSVVYQTLTIHIGTAEYGLSTTKLYNQIIDAYSSNLFQVMGECSVLTPDALNYEEIYNLYCTAPQDAVLANPDTFEITPEVYGYGFELDALKLLVSGAEYGTTVEMPLKFIRPNLTAEDLSGDTFKDTLSSFRTKLSDNADYNHNIKLVCNILNNMIIKSGETFSFNTAVGQPTAKKGYKTVKAYAGKEYTNVLGGGISQVSSTMYYCALNANLAIVERLNHYYVPSFCDAGMDAYVSYGSADLRFTNSTGQPIRIQATVSGGNLEIALIGTSQGNTVKMETEVIKTYEPTTLLLNLPADNAAGYKAGDILVSPIAGCSIKTYRCVYSGGTLISRELISQSYYEKRNAVVVNIQIEIIPDPSDPTDSSESTGDTESSEGSEPTVNTEPTQGSEPTVSTEPQETEPVGSTEESVPANAA